MALKLTFEAEMKGAQDVGRVLDEWEKKLNRTGQAGEEMSSRISSGLETITKGLSNLTDAQGGVENLTKRLEGVGDAAYRGLNQAHEILLKRMRDGVTALEKEAEQASQKVIDEMKRVEDAKARGASDVDIRRAEDKLAEVGLQFKAKERDVWAKKDELKRAEAEFGGEKEDAFSREDRSILKDFIGSLQNLRNPMQIPQWALQQYGQFGPGGKYSDTMAGAVLGSVPMRAVGAAAGVGVAAALHWNILEPQWRARKDVLAPLAAMTAERQRELTIGGEAAAGDITSQALETMQMGALYDFRAGKETKITEKMKADILEETLTRNIAPEVGETLGGAAMGAGALLMFVNPLLGAAVMAAGYGLHKGSEALYKSEDQILQEKLEWARQFDKKKYGLAMKSAGKYYIERGKAIGEYQRQFGREAASMASEDLMREAGLPLDVTAEAAKPLARHGMLPSLADVPFLMGREAYGITENLLDVGARIKRRAGGDKDYTYFTGATIPDMLLEAGLAGRGTFAGRQELFQTIGKEAGQHFITDEENLASLAQRYTTAAGMMTAAGYNEKGEQTFSPVDIARFGGELGRIGKGLERSPTNELGVRLHRMLISEGFQNPYMRDNILSMDLRRPETVRMVLASKYKKDPSQITDEQVQDFQQKYQNERSQFIKSAYNMFGVEKGDPLGESTIAGILGVSQPVKEMISKGKITFADYFGKSPEELDELLKQKQKEANTARLKEKGYFEALEAGQLEEGMIFEKWLPDFLRPTALDTPEKRRKFAKERNIDLEGDVYKGAEVTFEPGKGVTVDVASEIQELRLATSEYQRGLESAFAGAESALLQVGSTVGTEIRLGFERIAERIKTETEKGLTPTDNVMKTRKLGVRDESDWGSPTNAYKQIEDGAGGGKSTTSKDVEGFD